MLACPSKANQATTPQPCAPFQKKNNKKKHLHATESEGRKGSDTQNYIYVLKKSRHGSAASFLLYLDCNLTMFRESREERPRQPSSTHLQREASMIVPLYIGIRTPYPPSAEVEKGSAKGAASILRIIHRLIIAVVDLL